MTGVSLDQLGSSDLVSWRVCRCWWYRCLMLAVSEPTLPCKRRQRLQVELTTLRTPRAPPSLTTLPPLSRRALRTTSRTPHDSGGGVSGAFWVLVSCCCCVGVRTPPPGSPPGCSLEHEGSLICSLTSLSPSLFPSSPPPRPASTPAPPSVWWSVCGSEHSGGAGRGSRGCLTVSWSWSLVSCCCPPSDHFCSNLRSFLPSPPCPRPSPPPRSPSCCCCCWPLVPSAPASLAGSGG